jgi:hypothetical protein
MQLMTLSLRRQIYSVTWFAPDSRIEGVKKEEQSARIILIYSVSYKKISDPIETIPFILALRQANEVTEATHYGTDIINVYYPVELPKSPIRSIER